MINFIDFRAQHLDDNGNPLAGGRILAYEAGTDNPKQLYADINLTIPYGTTVDLDANGRPNEQVFMGLGNYKFRYQSKDFGTGTYTEIDIMDNIEGGGAVGDAAAGLVHVSCPPNQRARWASRRYSAGVRPQAFLKATKNVLRLG